MGCGASTPKGSPPPDEPVKQPAENAQPAPVATPVAAPAVAPPVTPKASDGAIRRRRSSMTDDVKTNLRRKSIAVLAKTGLVAHEVEALVDVMKVSEM